MNSKSQLIYYINKFSQLFNFLNEYTDLKNLWMTTSDLWNSNERKLLCYFNLKKEKSIEYMISKKFRKYLISRVSNPNNQISLNLSEFEGKTDVRNL